MRGETVQLLAVALIVAAALFYWISRLRRMSRGEPMCGKCPGCGTEDSACGGLADAIRALEERRSGERSEGRAG